MGRALLFETVNDVGEYHHNYFIHSSSLSTNNTLSLSLSLFLSLTPDGDSCFKAIIL